MSDLERETMSFLPIPVVARIWEREPKAVAKMCDKEILPYYSFSGKGGNRYINMRALAKLADIAGEAWLEQQLSIVPVKTL